MTPSVEDVAYKILKMFWETVEVTPVKEWKRFRKYSAQEFTEVLKRMFKSRIINEIVLENPLSINASVVNFNGDGALVRVSINHREYLLVIHDTPVDELTGEGGHYVAKIFEEKGSLRL